ncbi:MAG TPA: NADH:flavin oxidoreductase [Acidobacteriota bacterium]|nr:NADH:flavin oxidoreductase [Acidobacteriota bacterium]
MKLFTPFNINGMILPNRLVLPAMVTRLSGEDGFVNEDIRQRYLRFAKGEPGLIVIEAMAVHTAKSGPLLRLSEDAHIPGLAALAKEIHEISPSKVVPQIIHFLKIARSGWRQKIKDLSHDEIRFIVDAYAASAERARRAGFDGVELHMAHAYTLSSFLSLRNTRNDEYGRSLENRMRLMSEVITAVRSRIGSDFPLGVRFDGEECIKNGYTLKDSKQIALRMAQQGVDYISISAGGKFEDAIHKPGDPLYPYTGYSGDRCMPSANYPDMANMYLASGIKQFLLEHKFSLPVVTTGKIRTPEQAEEILQEGHADLIGMARALLADPDLPRKARDDKSDMIIWCTYGNVCKNLDENFRKVTCVLWPKGSLQAPESSDTIPPVWPNEGAQLSAEYKMGQVFLKWNEAIDNEAVYGYEIYRSIDNEKPSHLATVKRNTHYDLSVAGGAAYSYFVVAYDLAGNRTIPSNVVNVTIGLRPGPADAGIEGRALKVNHG